MSLFHVFKIAGSGLQAQTVRMNTTASNLANADSVANKPEEAYRARQPVFSAELSALQSGQTPGVQIKGVVESDADVTMRYEPNNPIADEKGYVYGSNVNTVEELVNMISASRSYQNNIEVMNNSKQMLLRTLQLGK